LLLGLGAPAALCCHLTCGGSTSTCAPDRRNPNLFPRWPHGERAQRRSFGASSTLPSVRLAILTCTCTHTDAAHALPLRELTRRQAGVRGGQVRGRRGGRGRELQRALHFHGGLEPQWRSWRRLSSVNSEKGNGSPALQCGARETAVHHHSTKTRSLWEWSHLHATSAARTLVVGMDRLPPCPLVSGGWRGPILKNANKDPHTLRICEPVGGRPPTNTGRFSAYPDSSPTTISRTPPLFYIHYCNLATIQNRRGKGSISMNISIEPYSSIRTHGANFLASLSG
jgi:hypothetical protein